MNITIQITDMSVIYLGIAIGATIALAVSALLVFANKHNKGNAGQ